MRVIKRDGRRVVFNKEKIITAVLSAFEEVDGEITKSSEAKAKEIASYIEAFNKTMNVEEIQNIVEEKLMASARKDVARRYLIYRADRDRERQRNSKATKMINSKIKATSVENQNANMDERSFGGKMGMVTSEILKDYALNYIVSDMAKNNHLNNEIYIHDLDHYAIGDHNCLSIPFDDLLSKGFNTRQTDVRPANSINTAFQLVAVIFQLQSLQQFGGVSATHLDWTMVPYVRKSFYKHFCDGFTYILGIKLEDEFNPNLSIDDDYYTKGCWSQAYQYAMDKTNKETQQAVEGMYHNLNY